MSKTSPKIVTATERNKEQKEKEDFATQNYSADDTLGSDVVKRTALEMKKAETEKELAVKEKPLNQDFNFIDDETFQKELDYLGYTPHSDLILLLAPRIKQPDSSLILSTDQRNKLMTEQLDKLPGAMRILAIAQEAKVQNTTFTTGADGTQEVFEEFKVGDYCFYNNNLIMILNMQPLNKDLMYYQTRNMDIRYTLTQEQALKFKNQNNVA